jgi:hypothetical protein
MQKLIGDQVYELARTEPHIRRDGTETELAVWQSHCAQCGEPFEFRAPSKASKFEPNRRCAKHKRPGARVKSSKTLILQA